MPDVFQLKQYAGRDFVSEYCLAEMSHIITAWSQLNIGSSISVKCGTCGLNEICAFAHFVRMCYLSGMAHVITAWSQLNIRVSVSIKCGAC